MSSKPSSKQSRHLSPYERPIVYDREILIEICTRLLQGEDLRATCAKPPMPRDVVFLGWIQDHKEAREIYRSSQNFKFDRSLAKELGTVLVVSTGEWLEQVRTNIQRGWPADYIDRGYIPPDWSKVFPVIGRPPVDSADNMQAYNDLLNSFTQMLQPRDLMELMWTKQATDATWEGLEEDEEKKGVISVAEMATGRDLRRVFDAGFNYCRSTQVAQSRLIKRRDDALRQLERWRKGLGAKSRRLPDQFLDEQVLAQRYRDQVPPDNDVTAPEPAEVAPPVAPAEAAEVMISASPSLAQSDKAGSPPDDSSGDAVKSVARPAPADGAMHVAPPTASLGEAVDAAVPLTARVDEAARVEPPTASSGEAVAAAVPLTARVDEAAQAAPPVASSGEAVDAVPLSTPADEAAQAAPPVAPPAEPPEAAPTLTPPDGAAQAAHTLAASDQRWRPPPATASCKSAATKAAETLAVPRKREANAAAEANTAAGQLL
jgi:hypothetical protein